MKQVIKVDENGLYVEPILLQDDEVTPDCCIESSCPDGLWLPKWNGSGWVEGGSAPIETPEMIVKRLKISLAETDYAIIKIAEGAATVEEYAKVIAQRQAWRTEINRLENSVD